LGQQRKVTGRLWTDGSFALPLSTGGRESVKSPWIPAFAGMTNKSNSSNSKWIPAFAGMTSNRKGALLSDGQ
jgi:hypothetical protein